MVQTARAVGQIPGKTVVFTGALSPARFKEAMPSSIWASRSARSKASQEGTFIAMNGQIFEPGTVEKIAQRPIASKSHLLPPHRQIMNPSRLALVVLALFATPTLAAPFLVPEYGQLPGTKSWSNKVELAI